MTFSNCQVSRLEMFLLDKRPNLCLTDKLMCNRNTALNFHLNLIILTSVPMASNLNRSLKRQKHKKILTQTHISVNNQKHIHLPDGAVTWPPVTVISIIHFVLRSRTQPQELNRWDCVCVCVCADMCEYTRICLCVCLCVCVKMLEMKISPAAELLTVIHALCTRTQTLQHTRAHTHLPLLKRHIQWIYCALSCCLLWMERLRIYSEL